VLALAAPGRSEEAAVVLGDVYRRLGIAHTVRNLAVHQPAAHTVAAPAAR
jgi:hypothetical protein